MMREKWWSNVGTKFQIIFPMHIGSICDHAQSYPWYYFAQSHHVPDRNNSATENFIPKPRGKVGAIHELPQSFIAEIRERAIRESPLQRFMGGGK